MEKTILWSENRYSGKLNIFFLAIILFLSGTSIFALEPFELGSGDLNGDEQVDILDFSLMANNWLGDNCELTDNCNGADLDKNGFVDIDDVALFIAHWREKEHKIPRLFASPFIQTRILDAVTNVIGGNLAIFAVDPETGFAIGGGQNASYQQYLSIYKWDGVTATKIGDRNDASDPYFYDPENTCVFSSAIVTPAGWLVEHGNVTCKKYYLSTDQGCTWTVVLDDAPHTTPFSWSGVDGEHIVVGPYTDIAYAPHHFYISDDGGATWTLAYTNTDTKYAPAQNMHIHTVAWVPNTNHTQFYVSRGDGTVNGGIYVVKKTDGVWDKDPSKTWENYDRFPMSTSIVNRGDYTYFACEDKHAPTVWRFNPATNEIVATLRNNNVTIDRYLWQSENAVAYFMQKCGNNYYLGTLGKTDHQFTEIYASPDCENWVRLVNTPTFDTATTGYFFFAGPLNGKMYAMYKGTDFGDAYSIEFEEPDMDILDGISAFSSTTNLFPKGCDEDVFSDGDGSWFTTDPKLTISHQTYGGRDTQGCMHVTFNSAIPTEASYIGPYLVSEAHCNYKPVAGDYVNYSMWVKPVSGNCLDAVQLRMLVTVSGTDAAEEVKILKRRRARPALQKNNMMIRKIRV